MTDLALLGLGCDADEVLEHLAAGLLLEDKRELDGAVQELGNDLNVGLEHIARSERSRSETNAAGHLCRGIARDGVFCYVMW